MTTLTIRHLGAEVLADLEQAGPARVDRLLRLVADRALEERHATYGTLTGEWFVRRLDLQLHLEADEPDSSAAARWASLIAGTIRDLVPDGSNVLHFRSRSRLLLDLAVGLTTGDLSRAWAWRQAGLLTSTDPDPADQPGAALLAAISRESRLALPVLVRTVEQAGVRALHATLGPGGWPLLADLVRPGWRPGWRPSSSATVHPRSASPGLEQRAAAVLAGSTLASAVRSCLPTPDGRTASALAVLVLAEVDPAGVGVPELLPWIARGLARSPALEPPAGASEPAPAEPDRAAAGRDPSRIPSRIPSSHTAGSDPARSPSAPAAVDVDAIGESNTPEGRRPTVDRPAGSPARRPGLAAAAAPTTVDIPSPRPSADAASPTGRGAPPADLVGFADQDTAALDSEPEAGAPTSWAGLLFVLNAAAAARLPDVVETDVRLAGRPLRWVLHQLALRLVPVAVDDPAALALAGLTPTMPKPDGPPVEPVEEEALDQHVAEWAAAVGRVLERARHPEDDTPTPTLWSLARRRGWIVADPGWLEVQLSLDDIDLLVRRAGLDLDPGWLGWLGTVVVFRYV